MANNEQELLREEEQREHYNDSGLMEEHHWMIDDLLQAQVAKLKAIGYEQVWEKCPDCNGGGLIGGAGINDRCDKCNSTGRKRKLVEWDREEVAREICPIGDSSWCEQGCTGCSWLKYNYKTADQLHKILTGES